MADAAIGRSGPMIRAPGTVDRAGTATDRQKHRRDQQHPARQETEDKSDRRSADAANRHRRRLFDLLFEEIDHVSGLDRPQKERLKRNLRAHLAARRPPPHPDALPEELRAAAAAIAATGELRHEPPPSLPTNPDPVLAAVAPDDPDQPPDEAMENAALAAQLRDCLARRSDAARKVAFYLHLLLSIDGAFRPHVVMDV